MAGRTTSRMSDRESHPADDASASPLWPLVVILGEIAERVTRQSTEVPTQRPDQVCTARRGQNDRTG